MAFALTGCGGSDGDSAGAAPGGVVITAIDGYLQHAEVWVDTDGNFELDATDKNSASRQMKMVNSLCQANTKTALSLSKQLKIKPLIKRAV